MSAQIKNEEQDVFRGSETVILGKMWLKFLDDAGHYATRLYLLCDLAAENSNPDSRAVLGRYYGGDIRTLKLIIQEDIDRLEGDILAIRKQQWQMGLSSFRVDGDSLQRFIDAFSLQGCFAPERRRYYRRRVRGMMKHADDRMPLSLNELEMTFKASKTYVNALQKASY